LKRNQNAEALAAFRKELVLFPGETAMYPSILDMQFALHQRKDAMATLHDWAVADSANPMPASKLMALLVEDGGAAAAVTIGKDALIRLPEQSRKDDRLQTELGRAEILSGDKAGGIKRIRAVLARTDDPEMADNAAYVLADSGADLATAEKATRENINILAAASSTWVLGEDTRPMRIETSLLNSAWDTLGWTLFREGKPEEARSYLSAAWQGLLSPEVGEHLAEVQEALGNKAEALRTYELALAVVQPDDNLRERKALAIKPADMQTRVQALSKSGATATIADPAAELLRIHTVPLGPRQKPDRRLTYAVLLRDGKVVDVHSTTDRVMEEAAALFAKADFSGYFPANLHGTLVRTGQITCVAGSCVMIVGSALQP
jgi:tetratricopeptide (TPR) repeat protein